MDFFRVYTIYQTKSRLPFLPTAKMPPKQNNAKSTDNSSKKKKTPSSSSNNNDKKKTNNNDKSNNKNINNNNNKGGGLGDFIRRKLEERRIKKAKMAPIEAQMNAAEAQAKALIYQKRAQASRLQAARTAAKYSGGA
jgi:hypothetical protein